ncbi:MAG: zinc-ribbon domain-containing protein [Firmicutes bacterium]|nr:zinc-ribbon domain-containing protein [Bacillota bacterium]
MNKQLGTKWFTFYTKVRPWLACLMIFSTLGDFFQYPDVYLSRWWLLLYLLGAIAQPILCIIVAVKSSRDYPDFVRFVKGVLLFETINMAYQQGVHQYLNSELQFGVAAIVFVVILVIGYFVWYRLNVKYFEKRINVIETDYLEFDPNRITECKSRGYRDKNFFNACPQCGQYAKQYIYLNQEQPKEERICFCRKCGSKLIDDAVFCDKCGTKVIKE